MHITTTTKEAAEQKPKNQYITEHPVTGRIQIVKSVNAEKKTKTNGYRENVTNYEMVHAVEQPSAYFKAQKTFQNAEEWNGRIDSKLTKENYDSRYMPMSQAEPADTARTDVTGTARPEATGTGETEFVQETAMVTGDTSAAIDGTAHFPLVQKLAPPKKMNTNRLRMLMNCCMFSALVFWILAIVLFIVYFAAYAQPDDGLPF